MQNNIDYLIDIVKKGGTVKTGVDIYNNTGVLLLEKDIKVDNIRILETIKKNGVSNIDINPDQAGGLWDENGNLISIPENTEADDKHENHLTSNLDNRINEINEIKQEALRKYNGAKKNIIKVLTDIRTSGGQFDFNEVEHTVAELFNFITSNENAFAYLTKEIFSYDDYLYNHSINVCTIGIAVLNQFNKNFGAAIGRFLSGFSGETLDQSQINPQESNFMYYLPDELQDIASGFFLHDVGKVLIPDEILNKKGRLTEDEFSIVKKHSFEKGIEILDRNKMHNAFIKNITKYHHSAIFTDETNCYPNDKPPAEIPLYVKICKLTDIYDAMTSKRSYKDAFNPIGVVTEIFHKYAKEDPMLKFILHSFVKVVGIYPPGSVVYLQNGQMAYIIDGKGPIVIPFTDTSGNTIIKRQTPVDIGAIKENKSQLQIERRRPLISPIDVHDLLPEFLKKGL